MPLDVLDSKFEVPLQDPPKLEAPNDHLPKSLTFHKISW
jgi:hypothetical protein